MHLCRKLNDVMCVRGCVCRARTQSRMGEPGDSLRSPRLSVGEACGARERRMARRGWRAQLSDGHD